MFILPTSNGYHPLRELHDTPDFANLGILKAIRERRISALPWRPCNCDQRLEYPVNVMVMAKAAYPQLFSDINLEDWMIRFFRDVYRMDDTADNGLIDALWMNWARDRHKWHKKLRGQYEPEWRRNQPGEGHASPNLRISEAP